MSLINMMLLNTEKKLPTEAGITYEDFTTYTESDPNNKLSQTQLRSTFTNLLRIDADTYLWKNKSGQLQNFTYRFKLRITAISNATQTIRVNPFIVIEVLDDYTDNRINGYEQFGIMITSLSSTTVFHWYVIETYNITAYTSAKSGNYNIDTDYYVEIIKSGTSLTVKFYSDANFTTLIESLSLTLHADWNLPYLAVPQGINLATAIGISGYVEELYEV